MIGEFFLDIVFGIVSGIFKLLPDFSWSVETTAFEYFTDVLRLAGYMFPWNTVVAICALIFGLSVFRVVIAVIKSVWDLLPFA